MTFPDCGGKLCNINERDAPDGGKPIRRLAVVGGAAGDMWRQAKAEGADALLTGVETRSSSPVRLVRDAHYEANIRGIFPCGEGAGYAGGILSAAADGMRSSEQVCRLLEARQVSDPH